MSEYRLLLNGLEYLRKKSPFVPQTALVLGSGLGGLIKENEIESSVGYCELEGLPASTVAGHKGRFIFTKLGGVPVIAMQGRVHLYEGYSSAEVVMPVRLMGMLGAKTIILTNAAGGINKSFSCGDLMLISDHISSFVNSPLIGENIDELGTRFPDMSAVYSERLGKIAAAAAESRGFELKRGVYAQLTGPNYETPAEIRMLRALGADAVGMSTAIESMAAVHMGMEVCAISLISNLAAGMSGDRLSHDEVQRAALSAGERMSALITDIVKNSSEDRKEIL